MIDKLQLFKTTCQDHGIRLTHQRLEIFRALASFSGHPSAEEIYDRVRRRIHGMAFDTVYRTLSTFEKINIVKRVKLTDDRARFDTNLAAHHHLICTKCSHIEDISWPVFDDLPDPELVKAWGTTRSKHVEIIGLCRRCEQNSRKSRISESEKQRQ